MEEFWLGKIVAPLVVLLVGALILGVVKTFIGFTRALTSITGALEYIRENLERQHERISFLERRRVIEDETNE